jgi:hypothetical protein
MHRTAGLKPSEVAADKHHDSNSRRVRPIVEVWFDETIRHRQATIRIESHSCVIDVGQLVIWNLGVAVGRRLIFTPVHVVGNNALWQALFGGFLRTRSLGKGGQSRNGEHEQQSDKAGTSRRTHELYLLEGRSEGAKLCVNSEVRGFYHARKAEQLQACLQLAKDDPSIVFK